MQKELRVMCQCTGEMHVCFQLTLVADMVIPLAHSEDVEQMKSMNQTDGLIN